MHAHCIFTTCHPSHHSLPRHPFDLAGPSLLLWISLVTIRLCLPPVRRGRICLGDYDAISVTRSRDERRKATILVATTNAFDTVGELDRQLFRRVFGRRFLVNISQYDDK